MVNSGLRVSEFAQLKWQHVTKDGINVVSSTEASDKIGKASFYPFKHSVIEFILMSLKKSANGDYVSQGMAASGIITSFKRSAKRADLTRCGVHMLRHTFISHLVMAGVPIRTVQELAGHASIKTTERYAHLFPQAMAEAVNRLAL